MLQINNKTNFTDKLISRLLENGFDFLSGEELKIYILYLLLEDRQFVSTEGDIDFHEISLALKINKTKVRNLVYEVELKYRDNHYFIGQLISIIEKRKYEANNGSFEKHIVSISKTTFEKLLLKLYGNSNKVEKLIDSLPENIIKKVTDKENLIKEFVREFGKSFSNVSRERSANLLFQAIDPVSLLKRLFV